MHNCQTRRCGVGLCFRIHEGAAGARDFVDSACLLERSQTREGKKGKKAGQVEEGSWQQQRGQF